MERGRTEERASRWGGPAQENFIRKSVNLPTLITGALTPEQIDAYQVIYRIDEITHKISNNDIAPPKRISRSPSPPPIYDASGRRTNTREARYKKSLEDERHHLIDIAARIVPNYVAPTNYRRPKNLLHKYYIPVKEHPEINFIGLLLGPRGNTLRKLQEDSGAKIAIRGKGSVKEGKNRGVSQQQNNLEDPLHCLITADDEDKVEAGIAACKEVVDRAINTPEGQNDLKRGQLRELAELNGTLREDDDRPCSICGLRGHKRWECPNRETYTSKVVCRICGNVGHFARDCKQNNGMSQNTNVAQEVDNMLNNLNATYNNNDRSYRPKEEHDDENPTKRRNTNIESPYARQGYLPPPPSLNGPPPGLSLPPGLSSHAPSVGTQTPPGLANTGLPPGLSTAPSLPPGLSQLTGLTAPPGLSQPPGLSAPPGLSQPPGLNAPPGLTAPPGLSLPPAPPGLNLPSFTNNNDKK